MPNKLKYMKCPSCGFATLYRDHPTTDKLEELLLAVRKYLVENEWDKKARLLRQEIDVMLLIR